MNKIPFRKIFAIVFIIVAFAWIWLFFSGQGILVGSEEVDGTVVNKLECTYFTGGGFVTKEVVKTDIDMVGSLVCPRMARVD